MLDDKILHALKGYTADMQTSVTFVLQAGDHPKRQELVNFLTDIASVSDKLSLETRETKGLLRSPITFALETDGQDTGIRFSGIPSGHEFNSLVSRDLAGLWHNDKAGRSPQRHDRQCTRRPEL